MVGSYCRKSESVSNKEAVPDNDRAPVSHHRPHYGQWCVKRFTSVSIGGKWPSLGCNRQTLELTVSTKCSKQSWMVKAVLPTPPSPSTTSL